MKSDHPLSVFFGHHKCATVWINQICGKACAYLGMNHQAVYMPRRFNGDLGKFVTDNRVDFLTYGNAHFDYVQQLENFLGFHVVRDPRDIMVSAYFSHLNSHPVDEWPELAAHRKILRRLSKDEGLLLDMEFNHQYMEDILSWDYSTANVLQIRMENLVAEPYQKFSEIFTFLGMMVHTSLDYLELIGYKLLRRGMSLVGNNGGPHNPKLSKENLLKILDEMEFVKASGGRRIGEEDPNNHFRKGIAGDWMNHFKPEHISYFVEHYNDVLLKLGYEDKPNWAERDFSHQEAILARRD
jgi:hypothetical protein